MKVAKAFFIATIGVTAYVVAISLKRYWLKKNLPKYQAEWFEENAPFGKELGYPDCCIKEFCDQPPIFIKTFHLNDDDRLRYHAGCINGKFTGFIPCLAHAKQIKAGTITLQSLIKNRSKDFGEFPDHNK